MSSKPIAKKYIVLFCLAIFFITLIVHYAPIIRKGYEPTAVYEEVILARNLSLTNKYSTESEKNIILSSAKVFQKGIISNTGNKLTPILYSQFFNLNGFDVKLPLYISIIFSALTSVLLFLLALRLFNLKVALLAALIYILLPVIWLESLIFGYYEFALFFFLIALLFYLYRPKANYLFLILSSIFFGLAILCRNALLFSFIPFLIYDFYKSLSLKRGILFVVPAILIISAVWIPDFLAGQGNAYLTRQSQSLGTYAHLFGDPYTYHFAKDEFLASLAGTNDPDTNEYLLRYNQPVSFKNKVGMYWNSVKDYPREAIRLVNYGGPVILLLILAGLTRLWQKRKELFKLFIIWLVVWYFLLIVLKTNNWVHFVEISFIVVTTVTIGFYWLVNLITQNLSTTKKSIITLILLLGLLGHMIISDKWMFHEEYNTGNMKEVLSISQSIINAEVTDEDVIAFGWHPNAALALNYYTDKNIVLFTNDSLRRAMEKGNLKEAFNYFGVTKIIGYSQDLTDKILEQVEVEEIEADYRR